MALRAGGSGTDFWMAPSAAGSKGRLASGTVCGASVPPWGRRIEGSCRGRGPETPDGIALHVCLQTRLPVCGAHLAVGFAPPLQVVEGL